MQRYSAEITALLKETAARLASEQGLLDTSLPDLELPPDSALGDFAFPCFTLSKAWRKAPPQIAEMIRAAIAEKLPAHVSAKTVGPYLNFTIKADRLAMDLLGDILAGSGLGSYGKFTGPSRGNWVLEFSSPNVAKPFQIYHLRPTILGATLDRIGRFRGYNVTSINHLGDWGTQYGKLAIAMERYATDFPADPTIDDLVGIYVRFHADAEKDPALEDQARAAFVKLEKGDAAMTAIWKKCVDISMKEFNRIYGRIHVKFDHIWGESYYKEQLAPLLERLRKADLLVQSEGAWVVPVTDSAGKELPPCILEKSDGSTIYATRDVAAALYRFEKFKFDRMTYIVGGEQRLHFQQVFAVLKKMGEPWVDRCEHVPMGLYRFKDAKMSTRKGNFVTLENVLELAKERVVELMKARGEEKPDADVTEKVAVGAVAFHDLFNDPARDVEFDIEKVVDFDGETGPYLQYAHTRCASILKKAGTPVAFNAALIEQLQEPSELALIRTLGQFPLHLERTLEHSKASHLAHYMVEITKAFGLFYRECQVLGLAPEVTQARLMLVEATRRVLAQGLGLLGVPLPERM